MKACIKFSIVIFASLFSLLAHAEVTHNACHYENTKLSDLNCSGPAILTNVTVSGKLDVAGSLTLQHAIVNSVNVKGSLLSNESTIKGDTAVNGSIMANRTLFVGQVFAVTDKVQLSESTLLSTLSVQSNDTTPVVHVNKSTLQADVNFTQKSGTIDLISSHLEGTVKNGMSK